MLCAVPIASHVAGNAQELYAENIAIQTTVSSLDGLKVMRGEEELSGEKNIATKDIIIKDGVEYIAVVKGDVNGDGNINSTDFMQVRRAYLGLFDLDEACAKAADVNGDGKINSTDFMQIRRHYLKLYEITAEGDIIFGKPVSVPDVSEPSSDASSETPSEPTASEPTVSTSDENTELNVHTITSGGTYAYSGVIADTMITVDAADENVYIILDGVTVNNSNGPALFVRAAKNVYITVADGTVNTLSDGVSYVIEDSGSTLDGAIFSKSDLIIDGNGTLKINGNYKHGIVSKDDLKIEAGNIEVTSAKVGLNGKDSVKIYGGEVSVTAGSDGIRSDNAEDTAKGYVSIYGGKLDIIAGNDGIQAETSILIEDGEINIKSGGGSSTSLSNSDESYKGIKATTNIDISGGKITVNSQDDSIHSNATINITGGSIELSSGDDGIHADTDLNVSGSSTEITVLKSYEGLEATNISISDGTVDITASDDGLNAAGGNDSSSSGSMGGFRPGQGSFSSSNGSIKISGGTVHIAANGDCLDANGTLSITGGFVTAGANISGDTAILDFDSSGTISGGVFVGYGASGMSQNFSTSSTQGVIMLKISQQSADTAITLKDSNGNVLLSKTADRAYTCVIISCADIVKGDTYTVTAGSVSKTVTMSSTVYGSSNGGGGRF